MYNAACLYVAAKLTCSSELQLKGPSDEVWDVLEGA